MSAVQGAGAEGVPSDIRVMIVDDSAVVRGLTSRWIAEEPGLCVVALHANGRRAVEDVAVSQPDVVILDIEMPEMDGLTALPLLFQKRPGLVVIVSSTLSQRGAEISLRALALGAAECIAKPDGSGRIAGAADYRRLLINLIRQLGAKAQMRSSLSARVPASRKPASPTGVSPLGGRSLPSASSKITLRPYSRMIPRVLALGSSTGGPQALVSVLSACADALSRVPILIVQHMPPTFTAQLAAQLGRATGLPAAEARDAEVIVPGRIYVAPGGFHLLVEQQDGEIIARLSDAAPEHFCKPAVDPLFRSIAKVYGKSALGVVLTGMGADGGAGAVAIADNGGSVIIQNEETSVVWGMPGAVASVGACAGIFPLSEIGRKLQHLLRGNQK